MSGTARWQLLGFARTIDHVDVSISHLLDALARENLGMLSRLVDRFRIVGPARSQRGEAALLSPGGSYRMGAVSCEKRGGSGRAVFLGTRKELSNRQDAAMANIAFLGAGLMGAALAEAAAGRGDRVKVWNRTPAKARALEPLGIVAASTIDVAVDGAERIHVVLSDDAVVDAVLEEALGKVGSATVVDHSTTSPSGTAERAKKLEARGLRFLHCPVFMSPKMCREAAGIMLAAGLRSTFESLEGALRAMTGRLEYLGERRDLAAAQKLFGNAVIIALCGGLADVYAMAASLGIDPHEAHSLFAKFNPTGVLTYRGAATAEGDYTPAFELSMARKDARLMIESARGRELPVLDAIAKRMDALIARGYGSHDLGVLAVDAVSRTKPV